MALRPPASLLHVVNIGDISPEPGRGILVKPFQDREASPWKDDEWELRLLNAGEWIECNSAIAHLPEGRSKIVALNIQILARSLMTVNGQPLYTDEDIKSWNKDHGREEGAPLDRVEFLTYWLQNLEISVLNIFEDIYIQMMTKQTRKLQGIILCEKCGREYTKATLPVNSQICFGMADTICGNCVPPEPVVAPPAGVPVADESEPIMNPS
jgi:hypothetical protein